MILNDIDLERAINLGEIKVDPFDERRIQPSSLDLTLDNHFCEPGPYTGILDLKKDNSNLLRSVTAEEHYFLPPKGFALASTKELIGLPANMAARVEGKSSLGRLGLMVHITAGFIDPGFCGQVTLELHNVLPVPMRLYPGMPIAQLAVFLLTGNVRSPYAGKYQDQSGPQQSRYHQNFEQMIDTKVPNIGVQ